MVIPKCNSFLLVFLTIMILTNYLSAQVSLGLQGGLNISKVDLNNEIVQSQISSINSFTFGAIINYKLNSIISLQSELRYLRSGNEQNMGGNEIIIDHFDYLEIPIYAIAELPNSFISPFALVGINMGYLLKATQKYHFHNSDFTEYFNKSNFSIDVGLGVKHSFYKNIWVQFSSRYSFGMYSLDKEHVDGRKTRGIQILLGVLYNI